MTVPSPPPGLLTVRVKPLRVAKVAVTVRLLKRLVTIQVEPETESHCPVPQPAKVEPASGVAVSVTVVPLA